MKTCFTRHAWSRVLGRLTLPPAELADILDWNLAVDIGIEESTNRVHRLFYSSPDDMCFVAIQDRRNGAVVTVLPIDYHETCAFRVSDGAQEQARALVRPTEHARPVPAVSAPLAGVASFSALAYVKADVNAVRLVKLVRVASATYDGCIERVLQDDEFFRLINEAIAAKGLERDSVETIYVRAGGAGRPVRVSRETA